MSQYCNNNPKRLNKFIFLSLVINIQSVLWRNTGSSPEIIKFKSFFYIYNSLSCNKPLLQIMLMIVTWSISEDPSYITLQLIYKIIFISCKSGMGNGVLKSTKISQYIQRLHSIEIYTLNNVSIPTSDTVRYLGFNLDERLAWSHIHTKWQSLNARMLLLRPLLIKNKTIII